MNFFLSQSLAGYLQGTKKATVGSKVPFSNKPLAWRQVFGNQLCGQANPRTVSAKQSAANKPVVEGCFNSLVSPERGATFTVRHEKKEYENTLGMSHVAHDYSQRQGRLAVLLSQQSQLADLSKLLDSWGRARNTPTGFSHMSQASRTV